jgi:hypothetical protein
MALRTKDGNRIHHEKQRDWTDWLVELLEPLQEVPVVGTIMGAVIVMSATMVYWFIFITLYCFILIPFHCLKGAINPNIPAWKILFESRNIHSSPRRLDFVVILAVHALFYGMFAYFIVARLLIGVG